MQPLFEKKTTGTKLAVQEEKSNGYCAGCSLAAIPRMIFAVVSNDPSLALGRHQVPYSPYHRVSANFKDPSRLFNGFPPQTKSLFTVSGAPSKDVSLLFLQLKLTGIDFGAPFRVTSSLFEQL